MQPPGKIIIFSAPSGSGKTTLVRHLLDTLPELDFSVSASTRPPRPGSDQQGQDYYFLTPADFRRKIEEDAFVEWEQVYTDTFYGTLKEEIERIWRTGKHVITDVDVKGGLNLKKYYGDRALAVFVKVPSVEALAQRLKKRASESPEDLARRLDKVRFEMSYESQFDVTLLNDDLVAAQQRARLLADTFLATGKIAALSQP